MCPLIMTAIPPDSESAIVSCGMEPVMFNKPEPLDIRNRFVQLLNYRLTGFIPDMNIPASVDTDVRIR